MDGLTAATNLNVKIILMNLIIGSKAISWTCDGKKIQPEEAHEVLDGTYDKYSDKVLVLCGERGVAQELMIFDPSGIYIFSLSAPIGYFQYFTFPNGSAAVACGSELNDIKIFVNIFSINV